MKPLFTILFIALAFQMNSQNSYDKNHDHNDSNNRRRSPSLTMGVQVIDPQGEYGDSYNGTPAGISGLFTVNWGRSPFEFGFGASWNSMGSISEDIMIYIGDDVDGNEMFNDGRMTVNANIYTYHAVGRFKPLAGPVQPYVDILGGFKTFSSKWRIKEDGSSDVFDESREKRDFALSSGWAAGLKIRLNEYMMLEGRFEKLKGGEVDFIDAQTLEIGYEGQLEYSVLTTNTNMNVFQLGVSIEF